MPELAWFILRELGMHPCITMMFTGLCSNFSVCMHDHNYMFNPLFKVMVEILEIYCEIQETQDHTKKHKISTNYVLHIVKKAFEHKEKKPLFIRNIPNNMPLPPPCKYFFNKDKICNRGNLCHYFHGDLEPFYHDMKIIMSKYEKNPCRELMETGFCANHNCTKDHCILSNHLFNDLLKHTEEKYLVEIQNNIPGYTLTKMRPVMCKFYKNKCCNNDKCSYLHCSENKDTDDTCSNISIKCETSSSELYSDNFYSDDFYSDNFYSDDFYSVESSSVESLVFEIIEIDNEKNDEDEEDEEDEEENSDYDKSDNEKKTDTEDSDEEIIFFLSQPILCIQQN